jgi:putative phage-type endonuclease
MAGGGASAPLVPSSLANGASEVVNIDAIIDRLIIRSQREGGESLDREVMIDSIVSKMDFVFNRNLGRADIVNRLRKVVEYKNQLQMLQNLPKLEQRTPAWYEARNNIITASDYAQSVGFGKFGTQKQFYEKKCGYEIDKFDSTMPALKWGIMFEPVAADAYSMKNEGIIVHEFGLLKHPKIGHLGASPDGISELGIMIEIKCPWRRKINGEIPLQYYYQMQGQLDVCGLDECDYLECGFSMYDDRESFVEDFDQNENFKGTILELEDGTYEYAAANIWNDVEKQNVWETEIAARSTIVARKYWKLHTYSVLRVYRDDVFLAETYEKLGNVWQNVVSFKTDKTRYDFYMHGASTKGLKPAKTQMSIDTPTRRVAASTSAQNTAFEGYAFVDDDNDDNDEDESIAIKKKRTSNVNDVKRPNVFSAYAFVDDD